MSGHAAAPAAAAPAAAPAAGPAAPKDPVKELALKIYVEMAGRTYAGGSTEGKPEPKALAMLSLKLADAFLQADREVNAALLEAARKRDTFSFNDVDMGAMMKG